MSVKAVYSGLRIILPPHHIAYRDCHHWCIRNPSSPMNAEDCCVCIASRRLEAIDYCATCLTRETYVDRE